MIEEGDTGAAAQRGGDNLTRLKDFRTENGHNRALNGLFVPNSLDSGPEGFGLGIPI